MCFLLSGRGRIFIAKTPALQSDAFCCNSGAGLALPTEGRSICKDGDSDDDHETGGAPG